MWDLRFLQKWQQSLLTCGIWLHSTDNYQQFVGQILAFIYQTKWHHIQTLQYVLDIHKECSKSNGPTVLMGMYVGSNFEDCVAGGHVMAQEMFWRKLHLKASQCHPICDMAVIWEICKSTVLHDIQILYIYIYIYIQGVSRL